MHTAEPLPRRLLVTGAGGAVGSAVARAAAMRGVSVVGLDRAWNHDAPLERRITGDASDPVTVGAALLHCDAVAHLAAIPSPHHADARTVHRTNTVSTFTVLSLAGEAGVRRAAIASSISAFGVPFNHRRPFPARYPIDESLPPALDDAYSLSKAQDELTAQMAASRWDMSVTALRLPHTGDASLFDRLLTRNTTNPDAAVREGWGYLHEDDAATAFLSALAPRTPGAEVVLVAAEHTLVPWPTEAALRRWAPGVPIARRLYGRESAIDTRRAHELFGIRATYQHPVRELPMP